MPITTPSPNRDLPGAAPAFMTGTSWQLAQDDDYGVQYDGWYGGEDAEAYGGGFRAAEAAGEWIAYRTTQPADYVTLLVCRGPDQGLAYPLIDGQFRGVLDLYAPASSCQETVTYISVRPLLRIQLLPAPSSSSTVLQRFPNPVLPLLLPFQLLQFQ